MSIKIELHDEGHGTYAEHAAKNGQDMADLLELLEHNLQLSITDLQWIQTHPKPTDEEIAEYLRNRTERDDD